jgi:hypothetical protein
MSQSAQSVQSAKLAQGKAGPHTGRRVCVLPVEDLGKSGAGCWNAKVSWKQSSLASFQNQPVVKAFHKCGSGTSAHPHKESNGVSISCKAPGIVGSQSVVVAFDIFFDPARWHWSRGGKIGGLFVGEGKASGGRHTPDGASHRIMFQADGGAISYCYFPAGVEQPHVRTSHAAMGEGYHHELFKNAFVPGKWHHVELGLKNNTFDASGKPVADGVASLTIDGKHGTIQRVIWSATPGTSISGFDLASFFGGPDPAVVDSVFYAANFAVHEWRA